MSSKNWSILSVLWVSNLYPDTHLNLLKKNKPSSKKWPSHSSQFSIFILKPFITIHSTFLNHNWQLSFRSLACNTGMLQSKRRKTSTYPTYVTTTYDLKCSFLVCFLKIFLCVFHVAPHPTNKTMICDVNYKRPLFSIERALLSTHTKRNPELEQLT